MEHIYIKTRSKNHLVFLLSSLLLVLMLSVNSLYADIERKAVTTQTIIADDETEIDVRIFKGDGDQLLIGFACDQGSSIAEEKTAQSLSEDGVEVWMPDMLSAYMLPKVRSSLSEIPTNGLFNIIKKAKLTNKKVYLVASGPDTDLVLRVAKKWEDMHQDSKLGGIILMFPRLNKYKPEPGKAPEYQDAVGTTTLPIMVLEGERTPNRWGLGHLTKALEKGGSTVYAKLIPGVRGYFFKRNDPNVPEDLVTTQLSGLIKASLFFLGRT